MILSDKYIVKEEKTQITLYELIHKDVLDGEEKPTGEVVVKEKLLGNYSRTTTGRKQAYTRIINCEISENEKQSLQEILDTVKRCEEQVVAFWEKQV